jgi:hypothetical protein
MMYLSVSQHVSGIIMPIIRRMVQNRQRLWCTALAVLQKTRAEEVVGVHLLGLVSLHYWQLTRRDTAKQNAILHSAQRN